MKLKIAAALFQSERRVRARMIISLALAGLLLFFSGTAMALDGIDLSGPLDEDDGGGCSELVQIKYPFLNCRDGEIGSTDYGENWDNHRQIPLMSDWAEGDGYWGPSLNEM